MKSKSNQLVKDSNLRPPLDIRHKGVLTTELTSPVIPDEIALPYRDCDVIDR